ncbi:hypothetical protein M569_17010, partial [Genlisea aurea]
SSTDKAHLKLAAAKAVLRLSKQWEQKIPVDVFYLTLRTSEEKYPEVRKLILSKVHQYVKDRILDPKYACAFLLDFSSSEVDVEEIKRYLSDIIQMCQQGKGRQFSLPADSTSPPLYPEYILVYVIHSIAHHPSFPDIDECKDLKSYEPMYRQLYAFLSMLVDVDADGKSDTSISKDKESISLLSSILQSIRKSEDVSDRTKSKNSYALCDLGISIIKRLAPRQGVLEDLSAPVSLPAMLYKLLEKKDESESQVNGEKTWLADGDTLAHFNSLKMEANAIVHTAVSEDEAMKDSESEASEMPLGKLMKRLKAKAAKLKKETTPARSANEKEIDVLKMVDEINHENSGTTSKFEWSNGNGNARKRRSETELHKNKKLKNESKDSLVPKRRRTSGEALKSSASAGPKDSKNNEDAPDAKRNFEFDGSDEDLQHASEGQNAEEKTPEPTELLFSNIRNKLSSSKQKGKRADRDNSEHNTSSKAK